MNAIMSALRFFFTQTLDRLDLARKLVRMRHERTLPVALSRTRWRGCWAPLRASAEACVVPDRPRETGINAVPERVERG